MRISIGMADPFVEQLKRMCREQPVAAKWIILPTPSIGWTLGERLLHEGCDWMNLRFTTPFQLALEACAPELLDQGILPCPDTLGPGLLQNLLLAMPQPDGHFRPLITQPGMAQTLWKTLEEFRLAGLSSTALFSLAFSPKIRELQRLFAAYELHLKTEGWADRADILSTTLPIDQIETEDLVVTYPYCCWTPLEQRLIQRLPGQHQLPEATEAPAPRFWSSRSPRPNTPPTSQFFSAPRRGLEIDEIIRRIEAGAIPLDRVEICALPEEALLIQERLQAVGFSATFEAGLPSRRSRPGQALAALLTWVEHGYTAYHLRELLLADLLRLQPNSFTAARLLQSARIVRGRESYQPRLQILEEIYRKRDILEGADHCQLLSQALSTWLHRLPGADEQKSVPLIPWIRGIQQILQSDFIPLDPTEDSIRLLLIAELEELKNLPGERWPLDRLLDQIRHRLQSSTAQSSRSRPGHVHVTRPAMLGLSGRPHVFLIGLEEGRWLTTQPEDCVLSDLERSRLHPDLRLTRDLPEFMAFQLRERMATVADRLTLSYAVRDRDGEREQLPSWIFFEKARQAHPHLENLRQLLEWLGNPVAPKSIAQRQLPLHLRRGLQAGEQRDSHQFTNYDGYVPEAAGLWDPRKTGRPTSVSRLTALATCPFQVFLEEGLKLSQGNPRLPDADQWLDPAARGVLLHEVLAAYHRDLRRGATQPKEQLLQAHLHAQLEKLRLLAPPPSQAIDQSECADLWQDLRFYLNLEAEATARTPVALEVPFGMEPDPLEPLSQLEPVILGEVPLSGRIDRIDRLPDGYAVVDYKTGKSLRVTRTTLYDRGRLLQHGLYALVAEQLLGKVVQSSYYFVRQGAEQAWVHYPSPDRDQLLKVLEQVLEPLASGAFTPTHQRDKDCTFCEYHSACHEHNQDRQTRKLENPANHLLQSRRELLQQP